MSLPEPDAAAKQHSQRLQTLIAQEIAKTGPISLARYMELTLYAPALGYYAVGNTKLGEKGDFITAPEISPLFAQTIAQALQETICQLEKSVVLELGAGSGQFAADFLNSNASVPDKYLILEVSPDFRARQQATLKTHCAKYFDRIEWLDTLPQQPFNGVIFANEVIDALPVHSFSCKNGKIYERCVTHDGEKFQFINTSPSVWLHQLVEELQIDSEPYYSEVNLLLKPWLKSLSDCLNQGLVLFFDYGFSQAEYYHAQRCQGTLMCHYRHHAHSDPFFYPGLQDITAHVDFTNVAICGEDAGLELIGYSDQASFLLDNGIEQLAQPLNLCKSKALQKLLFPHEMGELFKAIAFSKNYKPSKALMKRDLQCRL